MMMSTLYRYETSTKFCLLIGVVEPQKDVVSGEQLTYRNTTEKKPLPEKKGFVQGFVTGDWKYYPASREYWLADGSKHKTEDGEELPEGALLEVPVIPPSTDELAAQVRAKRDALVDQVTREINRLEDAGKDAKAWRDYRIVLRNVPEQAGFPQEIDWGKQPAAFTGK